MPQCPRCSESRTDLLDTTEDGRSYCTRCGTCWRPEPEPLLTPSPPVERERRDLA